MNSKSRMKIKQNYDVLRQIESYENILKSMIEKGNHSWSMSVGSIMTINISNGCSRIMLKSFIENEIGLLSHSLEESEGE